MVVDDCVVIRGLLSRWIDAEPDMAVVGIAAHRARGGQPARALNPDVAVLDVEMPELDGISALPLLLAKKRNLIIIMASTLTRRNAEISFKALSLGAADYIPKPRNGTRCRGIGAFHHDLIEKIRHLGRRGRAVRAAMVARHRCRANCAGGAAASRGRRRSTPTPSPRACVPFARAAAARAADRLFDRRAAGAHVAGRPDSAR